MVFFLMNNLFDPVLGDLHLCLFAIIGFINEYIDSSKLLPFCISCECMNSCYYELCLRLFSCFVFEYKDSSLLFECLLVLFASIGTRLCLYEFVFSFRSRVQGLIFVNMSSYSRFIREYRDSSLFMRVRILIPFTSIGTRLC